MYHPSPYSPRISPSLPPATHRHLWATCLSRWLLLLAALPLSPLLLAVLFVIEVSAPSSSSASSSSPSSLSQEVEVVVVVSGLLSSSTPLFWQWRVGGDSVGSFPRHDTTRPTTRPTTRHDMTQHDRRGVHLQQRRPERCLWAPTPEPRLSTKEPHTHTHSASAQTSEMGRSLQCVPPSNLAGGRRACEPAAHKLLVDTSSAKHSSSSSIWRRAEASPLSLHSPQPSLVDHLSMMRHFCSCRCPGVRSGPRDVCASPQSTRTTGRRGCSSGLGGT